jgi:SAM-dependent methyltransferase
VSGGERAAPGQGTGAFHQATGRALENSSGADQRRYRAFQYDLIAPHCGPSVLEVGAGLGEFAAQFRGLRRHIVTDVDPDAVASMARRFADRPEVEPRRLDLTGGEVEVDPPVSTVVAINVLEHIEDDEGALRALARAVEPGGRLVIWVPGYQQLYGDFDRKVGHVTRYTPATLSKSVTAAGLTIESIKPINFLGGIAWWAAVRRGGAGYPDPRLVKIYDRTVIPLTKLIERWIRPPFGQTVLCVARVPDGMSRPEH